MNERVFRIGTILGLGVLYVALLGYSLFGGDDRSQQAQASTEQTVPPRVIHHDSDVDVYESRTVRSSNRRGGGMRAGK